MSDAITRPSLPRSDSKEADRAIEQLFKERGWPTSPQACARLGFEAARRMAQQQNNFVSVLEHSQPVVTMLAPVIELWEKERKYMLRVGRTYSYVCWQFDAIGEALTVNCGKPLTVGLEAAKTSIYQVVRGFFFLEKPQGDLFLLFPNGNHHKLAENDTNLYQAIVAWCTPEKAVASDKPEIGLTEDSEHVFLREPSEVGVPLVSRLASKDEALYQALVNARGKRVCAAPQVAHLAMTTEGLRGLLFQLPFESTFYFMTSDGTFSAFAVAETACWQALSDWTQPSCDPATGSGEVCKES